MANHKQAAAPVKDAAKAPAQDIPPTAGPAANTQVAIIPDYIKKSQAGRGNENVGTEDLVIPRIELVQALSPCLKKNDPAYIEGAEQGMMFNSLTRRLYGKELMVCPVFFKKEWLLWKDRKKGGGFKGAHANPEAAALELAKIPEAERGDWDANETAQQLVLIVHPDGEIEEAAISMARTKLKVSRNWNSLIRINGNDRFSRCYNLFGISEQNNNKQDYWNFGAITASFAPPAVYAYAEHLYEAINSGAKKYKIDDSQTDSVSDDEAAAAGNKEY